jgi:hypothetical protein
MLQVVTNISITQQGEGRNKQLFFDFVNEWEANDSWEDFTNQAKITLPKNLYYVDKLTNKVEKIDNIGGVNGGATFMRGDKVQIISGYKYYKGQELFEDTSVIFEGYISLVSSKKPFEIHCEDNMYRLKQIPVKQPKLGGKQNLYSGKYYTVEKMLAEMLQGTELTVNQTTQTNIGDIVIDSNYTVMQVLQNLRKDAHLESFFRGNELTVGYKVYDPQLAAQREAKGKKIFVFQNNIVEDSLDYQNKKDIILSAVGYSANKVTVSTGKKTKDGQDKTKDERLEVLVYADKSGNLIGVKEKPFPEAKEGERRTFYFNNVTSKDVLIENVKDKLALYYYTGFKGSFTTFGTPFVEQGDYIYIIDEVLPERNGKYIAKSVKYTGGTGGLRQEITIAYLVKQLTDADLKTLLK